VIEFRGRNTGFTINVSDYAQPTVTKGYIDAQSARVKLLKETPINRVTVALGTFSEDLGFSFQVTWGLVSGGLHVIAIPLGGGTATVSVNIIREVVTTKSGGAMYYDIVMKLIFAGAHCNTSSWFSNRAF
jgi:hypothetical protein